MILFQGMSTVVCSTALAVAALLVYGTGRQPLAAARSFVVSLVSSRKYSLFFLSVIAILLLNKYELHLEKWIHVSYDSTSALTGWEGAWPAWLQDQLRSDALTVVCAVFYLVLFQATLIASIGIYTYRRDWKLFYAFCVAVLLNYLIAVPFYLFVPVHEVWYVHSQVRFLLPSVFPTFEQEYRALSGLDNCFPSLHTSISVTLALLANRSGIRRWAVFTWINAVVILFSIFYLGIHWFTDMAAGVALALLSVYVGLKAGARADTATSAGMRSPDMLDASRTVGS